MLEIAGDATELMGIHRTYSKVCVADIGGSTKLTRSFSYLFGRSGSAWQLPM